MSGKLALISVSKSNSFKWLSSTPYLRHNHRARLGRRQYNYIAEEAGFPNLGDATKYIPDYAFAAIAVNLNWANLNRNLTVRALAALREAVEWTSQNIEEVAKILTTVTHANLPHAHRALTEMLQGGVSPTDLHINKKALDAVFESMHGANLVSKDVELSYGICVDESFLSAS